LDSKQIHEQLHDDSDSFSEFSQNSDIDIFDHIDPDDKISGPHLSDSCGNSDDSQASANVGGDGGGGCSYNDENTDNEDGTFWDKNDHNFYMIPFHASSGYKPP
jgi:hypothetical protein